MQEPDGRDAPAPSAPPPQTTWRAVGELGTIGMSFVIALVMGVAGGWWVDKRFGTSPWGFLVGFCLGLAAGVLNVYRIWKSSMRQPGRTS
jgi:ATP synthase protein I